MRFYRSAIIFLTACLLSLSAKETDLLVVLFDAGETNALAPVLERMAEEKRDFSILTLGTSTELIMQRPALLPYAQKFSLVDKSWPREKELPAEEVQKVVQEYQPKIVVTGVAAQIQGQLLKAYAGKARTRAYWDNMSATGANSYFTTAQEVQKSADVLLVPSRLVAESSVFADRLAAEIRIVGQPTLDDWASNLWRARPSPLRDAHGLNDVRAITYIGSYGPEYERGLKLFVKCVLESGYDGKVLMSIHPKSDGAIEKKLCTDPRFLFLPISSLDAVALGDATITYNSSVAAFALFAGKRAFYVIPADDPMSNWMIDQNMTEKVSTPEAFADSLGRRPAKWTAAHKLSGTPENSVELLYQALTGD